MSKDKKTRIVKRWGLIAVSINDSAEMQGALDKGYEPFAVMTTFVPAKQSPIQAPGQQNGVVPISIMYFKCPFEIKLDENGKEMNVVTLFKRKPDEAKPEPA